MKNRVTELLGIRYPIVLAGMGGLHGMVVPPELVAAVWVGFPDSTRTMRPPATRIVVTGGPGGGKTTAVDLFRREIGDRVVIVPEAATILFQGGFPRSTMNRAKFFAQTAIFHVQRELEATIDGDNAAIVLCDRGTVDGSAYWSGPGDLFASVGTTRAKTLESSVEIRHTSSKPRASRFRWLSSAIPMHSRPCNASARTSRECEGGSACAGDLIRAEFDAGDDTTRDGDIRYRCTPGYASASDGHAGWRDTSCRHGR